MEKELKEILEQLKELTARVEALLEQTGSQPSEPVSDSEPVYMEAPAPVEEDSNPISPAAIRLTLNDSFRFRRSIFGGSAERMDNALSAIGAMTTADEVYTYLTNVLDQDVSDPDVEDFFRIVTLRFADHRPLML